MVNEAILSHDMVEIKNMFREDATTGNENKLVLQFAWMVVLCCTIGK